MPDLDVPEGSLAEARAENLNPVAEKYRPVKLDKGAFWMGKGEDFPAGIPLHPFTLCDLARLHDRSEVLWSFVATLADW
ncbi:hypothetical protein ACVWVQ_000393 [Thermostichus sp. MS-CIW-36]